MKARFVSKDCSDLVYCENCDAKFWYYEMNYVKKCPECGAELFGFLDMDYETAYQTYKKKGEEE